MILLVPSRQRRRIGLGSFNILLDVGFGLVIVIVIGDNEKSYELLNSGILFTVNFDIALFVLLQVVGR